MVFQHPGDQDCVRVIAEFGRHIGNANPLVTIGFTVPERLGRARDPLGPDPRRKQVLGGGIADRPMAERGEGVPARVQSSLIPSCLSASRRRQSQQLIRAPMPMRFATRWLGFIAIARSLAAAASAKRSAADQEARPPRPAHRRRRDPGCAPHRRRSDQPPRQGRRARWAHLRQTLRFPGADASTFS